MMGRVQPPISIFIPNLSNLSLLLLVQYILSSWPPLMVRHVVNVFTDERQMCRFLEISCLLCDSLQAAKFAECNAFKVIPPRPAFIDFLFYICFFKNSRIKKCHSEAIPHDVQRLKAMILNWWHCKAIPTANCHWRCVYCEQLWWHGMAIDLVWQWRLGMAMGSRNGNVLSEAMGSWYDNGMEWWNHVWTMKTLFKSAFDERWLVYMAHSLR